MPAGRRRRSSSAEQSRDPGPRRSRDDRPAARGGDGGRRRDGQRRDAQGHEQRSRDGGQRRDRGRDRRGGESRDSGPARLSANAQALASGGYVLPPLSTLDDIDPDDYPAAFAALGLSDRSLAVTSALGFQEPTPIQAESIPLLLDGADVVGKAQTGTGKTVAFGFPMVDTVDPDLPEVQGIVLVPTRELATQVFGVLGFLAAAKGLGACALMGGRRLADDFQALEARPQIVVGTPGRIIDHLNRSTLSLSQVSFAVLDEADRMLDIGFEPDIRRILGRSPAERQTALFSATIPTSIKTLIWRYMRDPVEIDIEPEQATAREINQHYIEVAERDKTDALIALMPRLTGRTLIFCNMKVTVDRLVRRLRDREISAEPIHGDLRQQKRDRVMEDFRAGRLQILIATNVASRGLDIPDVSHVINYDLPENVEEYIHRVGRTGRAGTEGSAISFIAEWDLDTFGAIQKVVGDDLVEDVLDIYATRD
ncbi:MAG: DEAD/DEAH box helicase [Chloroflexi bacterium]|nr:DEAD/DEAH box helicase [Chloroflexota bacterium]